MKNIISVLNLKPFFIFLISIILLSLVIFHDSKAGPRITERLPSFAVTPDNGHAALKKILSKPFVQHLRWQQA